MYGRASAYQEAWDLSPDQGKAHTDIDEALLEHTLCLRQNLERSWPRKSRWRTLFITEHHIALGVRWEGIKNISGRLGREEKQKLRHEGRYRRVLRKSTLWFCSDSNQPPLLASYLGIQRWTAQIGCQTRPFRVCFWAKMTGWREVTIIENIKQSGAISEADTMARSTLRVRTA